MYIRYQDRLEMMEKVALMKTIGTGAKQLYHAISPGAKTLWGGMKNIGHNLIHAPKAIGAADGSKIIMNPGRLKAFTEGTKALGNDIKAGFGKLGPEAQKLLKGTAITAGGLAGGYGGKQIFNLIGNHAKQTREAAIAENPEMKGLLESPLAKSPFEFYADK